MAAMPIPEDWSTPVTPKSKQPKRRNTRRAPGLNVRRMIGLGFLAGLLGIVFALGRLAWDEKVHADSTAGPRNVAVNPNLITGVAVLVADPQVEPARPENGVLKDQLAATVKALKKSPYGGRLKCSASLARGGEAIMVDLPEHQKLMFFPIAQTNWTQLKGQQPASLRFRFRVDVAHPTFSLDNVTGVIFDLPNKK